MPPSLGRLHFNVSQHRRKVLHQHAVDEDVSTADSTEEDAVGAVFKKGDKISKLYNIRTPINLITRSGLERETYEALLC